MKKVFVSCVVMMSCLVFFSLVAWAQENAATSKECVDHVIQVADCIKAEGFEAVAARIKPGGPYAWKTDGYVFCLDAREGAMLAHPYLPPQMMNRSLTEWTDSNGKAFIREMVELANTDGQGWVSYMARSPGAQEARLKETYMIKVPDSDVIVGAGYFPPTK